jgi:nitroimidazol reductase NimA-like FMN-containing flavoprotein (pyridoxamine 5'-phosphate oxidase superfamily)
MLRDARIGRLATVNERGHPSVVPFCFAVIGEDEPVVVSVLDEKPKHVPDEELARVRNITHNPNVAFVVDHYEEGSLATPRRSSRSGRSIRNTDPWQSRGVP